MFLRLLNILKIACLLMTPVLNLNSKSITLPYWIMTVSYVSYHDFSVTYKTFFKCLLSPN